jgi:hypothetical protein
MPAGLDAGDRQVVERLFLAGHLNIIGLVDRLGLITAISSIHLKISIATTSTLSVGVSVSSVERLKFPPDFIHYRSIYQLILSSLKPQEVCEQNGINN